MNDTPMMIYLAGPIDEADDATGWYAEFELPQAVSAFMPAWAYRGADHHTAVRVENINRHMIQVCDGVLVNLLDRAKAFGTLREVEFARLNGKPVMVVADPPLMGLSAFDVFQEQTLQRGCDRLVEVIDERMNQPPVHPALIIGFGNTPMFDQEDDD